MSVHRDRRRGDSPAPRPLSKTRFEGSTERSQLTVAANGPDRFPSPPPCSRAQVKGDARVTRAIFP